MCVGVLYEGNQIFTCADLARLVGQSNVIGADGWMWLGDSCLCGIDIPEAFARAGFAVECTDDVIFQWASPDEAAGLREFSAIGVEGGSDA